MRESGHPGPRNWVRVRGDERIASPDHTFLTGSCDLLHRQIAPNPYVRHERLRRNMPFLREKSGKWSPEKIIAFVGACVPIFWLSWRAWSGDLSAPRPVNDAIHSADNYTLWLVTLSLAFSPPRPLFIAPKLSNM